MNQHKIRLLLFLTIAVVSLATIMGSFYYLHQVLNTTLNIGFNSKISDQLNSASDNLKKLRALDPVNSDEYRNQFNAIEELRQIYSNPEIVKTSIFSSMTIYFSIGTISTLMLALLIAYLLSRNIDKAYKNMYQALSAERDKVRYLEEIASWQGLAKMLAHEIKNPLTPIEVMVTSLSKNFDNKSAEEFKEYLTHTETMVNEELTHLKSVVNNFSEFSTIPKVRLVPEKLDNLLGHLQNSWHSLFPNTNIFLDNPIDIKGVVVRADKTMIRQVFTNIIRNGIEANNNTNIAVKIMVKVDIDRVYVEVSNDGQIISNEMATKIFDPYVSTNRQKTNMGLGLAIVKKIIVEHGSDIHYKTIEDHPTFCFYLVRAS